MRVRRFGSPVKRGGQYGATRNPSKRSRGGSIGSASTIIVDRPRLETLRQERFGKKLKAELSGEAARAEKAVVTLPTLRFMRELPEGWLK